jgi:hypothetical protein
MVRDPGGVNIHALLAFDLSVLTFDFLQFYRWSYGSNRMQMKSDLQAVDELRAAIKFDSPALSFSVTTETASANTMLPGESTLLQGQCQMNPDVALHTRTINAWHGHHVRNESTTSINDVVGQ